MTAAELGQIGLLWLAGNVEVWSPVACLMLLAGIVGLVHLAYESIVALA